MSRNGKNVSSVEPNFVHEIRKERFIAAVAKKMPTFLTKYDI